MLASHYKLHSSLYTTKLYITFKTRLMARVSFRSCLAADADCAITYAATLKHSSDVYLGATPDATRCTRHTVALLLIRQTNSSCDTAIELIYLILQIYMFCSLPSALSLATRSKNANTIRSNMYCGFYVIFTVLVLVLLLLLPLLTSLLSGLNGLILAYVLCSL